MQKFTKIASIIAILVSSPLVYAQEGEFTIDITGPDEVHQPQVVQPRPVNNRATPVRPRPTPAPAATTAPATAAPATAVTAVTAAPTQANNQNVTMQGTRIVRNQDTIWSIASSLVPANRANNEYQIIASIYRYNPQAFRNGDVNQLIQGATLNIPSYATISKELTKSGSDLLQGIIKSLPPLPEDKAVAANTTKAPIQDKQLENNIDSLIAQLRQENAQSPQNAVSFARVPIVTNNENTDSKNTDELNQAATNMEENKQDQQVAEALNTAVKNQNKPALPPAVDADAIDVGAIFKILDDLETQINKQQDKVDKDIAKALVRSEAAAKNTARSTVENVMNNYDNIILELQQSNAELRSTIAKLNQQLDQVREFTLSTNDQIAGLESKVMGISPQNSLSNQGPLMLILLGGGLLALIMAVTLIFFKRKSNQATKELNKDNYIVEEDFGSDDVLITSTIGPSKEEIANAEKEYAQEQEKKRKEAEEQAKRDAATKATAEAIAAQKKGTKYVDDEIQIPDNLKTEPKNAVNTNAQAEQAKKAWNEAKETSEKKNEQITEIEAKPKATVTESKADTVASPKSNNNQDDVLADIQAIEEDLSKTKVKTVDTDANKQSDNLATQVKSIKDSTNVEQTKTQKFTKEQVNKDEVKQEDKNEQVKKAKQKEDKVKDSALLAQWANKIEEDDLSGAVQINRKVSSENTFIDTDTKTQQPLKEEAKTIDEVIEDQARLQDAREQELKDKISLEEAAHAELEAQKKFDDLNKILHEDDNNNLHLDSLKQVIEQEHNADIPQADTLDTKHYEQAAEPNSSADMIADNAHTSLNSEQFRQAIEQDVEQKSKLDVPLQSSQAEEELSAKFAQGGQNLDNDTLSASAQHLSNALEGKDDDVKAQSSLAEQEFRQSLNGDTDLQSHDERKERDLLGPRSIGETLVPEDDVVRPEFNFKNKISVEDALKSLEAEDNAQVISQAQTQDNLATTVEDTATHQESDKQDNSDVVKLESKEHKATDEIKTQSNLDEDLVLDEQDHDILNMIKDKDDDVGSFADVLKETQKADELSDQQIANMISTSNGQQPDIEEDRALVSEDSHTADKAEDKSDSSFVEDVRNAHENDMFKAKTEASANSNKTLSEMDIQRYNDELNLAHLYFETGDTDEAMNIVNEVLDKGNDELIKKANELLTNYAQ